MILHKGNSVKDYKVCVVDDFADEASVLCDGLRLNGYEAVAAHTGLEAVERCAQGDIELVLLDVGLPDIDGYEVCRRLKSEPKTAEIPVIFVTARGSATDVEAGFALGAVNYIVKPYNLPIVMVHVDSALRTRAATGPLHPTCLEDPVYTDSLTGLKNNRFLLERLQEETDKSKRYGHPVSCILLDVDGAVPIDEEEMAAPNMDDVLVEIAMAMRSSSRNYDIIARYDGPVFAAVLPHISRDHAQVYARKIADEIQASAMHDPFCPVIPQLSFGLATCPGEGWHGNGQDLLRAAMQDLLRSRGCAEAVREQA